MKTENRQRILYVVLNWGLGHATRSVPLIQYLSQRYTLIVASNGRARMLLRQEFPELPVFSTIDYQVYAGKHKALVIPLLAIQIPRLLYRIYAEHQIIREMVRRQAIDCIISDNCYGAFAPPIPTFFLTHQLRFPLPPGLRKLEFLSELFNRFFFAKYRRICVPDMRGSWNLSGKLSHSGRLPYSRKVAYIGILSRLTRRPLARDIDLLVSVSGPEPARSAFEELVLSQLAGLEGNVVVVLGKPEQAPRIQKINQATVYSHADRNLMNELMNRARLVVCRSGYSTIMELLALPTRAILVPTPGQTEQEYLAEYLDRRGWFRSTCQDDLNLARELARPLTDFPEAVKKIPVNDVAQFQAELNL